MSGVLLLSLRCVAFHKVKTAIVVSCVTLTLFLPCVMHVLVDRFQRQLSARADTTPLVVGAKGSRFDLVLHAMYFETQPTAQISMREVRAIRDARLAAPIPLQIRFQAQGSPIVGTTLDYFRFRQSTILRGHHLVRLGDCVLGAAVASRLALGPGDRLLSDPENLFDLAGDYPLKMRVVGVLAPSHSADDNAVFVDIKTAWIIAGIGHGHQDLAKADDENVLLEKREDALVANAALVQFTEITNENLDSFHFHGSPDQFPVSAIIAVPRDAKSATLLMGRFLDPDSRAQILRPADVVQELMELVFRAKRFFDLAAAVLGCVTVLFLILVILLSLRLRRREMETMFKLGCSRFLIFRLQAAELLLMLAMSCGLTGMLLAATRALAPWLLQNWLN